MKKAVGVFLLLVCFSSFLYGQKTRFGQEPPKAKPGVDYPIAVHIHETRMRQNCQYDWQSGIIAGPRYSCPDVVYLDAVMNGKSVELMGPYFQKFTISPGDYKARVITRKASNTAPTAMGLKYELLFPQGYIWRSMVTGVGE
jgi:hypothetical protein